jgi:hypothetical protein
MSRLKEVDTATAREVRRYERDDKDPRRSHPGCRAAHRARLTTPALLSWTSK